MKNISKKSLESAMSVKEEEVVFRMVSPGIEWKSVKKFCAETR